jgi:aconitate hydratase
MGVWPLEFRPGENRESLGITGQEVFEFPEVSSELRPKQSRDREEAGNLRPKQSRDREGAVNREVSVKLTDPKTGASRTITLVSRIDTAVEVSYYRNGGILPYVLRKLATP